MPPSPKVGVGISDTFSASRSVSHLSSANAQIQNVPLLEWHVGVSDSLGCQRPPNLTQSASSKPGYSLVHIIGNSKNDTGFRYS